MQEEKIKCQKLTQYLRFLESLGFEISFNYVGYKVIFKGRLLFQSPNFRMVHDRPKGPSENYTYQSSKVTAIKICNRYVEDHLL